MYFAYRRRCDQTGTYHKLPSSTPWPTLTKWGQSRWEDHEITGEKNHHLGVIVSIYFLSNITLVCIDVKQKKEVEDNYQLVVFDFSHWITFWVYYSFLFRLLLTTHFDLELTSKRISNDKSLIRLKPCKILSVPFSENGHSTNTILTPYFKRPLLHVGVMRSFWNFGQTKAPWLRK